MFLLTRDEEKHKTIVVKEEIFILTFFISPTTLTPGEASVWRDLGSFIDNDADALLTFPVLTRLDMNTGLGRIIPFQGSCLQLMSGSKNGHSSMQIRYYL